MTKISMVIALAVVLAGCADGSQSASYGNSSSIGTNGTARDALDNGGSTSTSMEAQRIKRHGYAP